MPSHARALLLLMAFSAFPAGAQNVLSVTKFPCPATPGTNCDFTIQVTNPDTVTAAASVTLTDPIPLQTSFVSFVQTNGPSFTCATPAVGAITGAVNCSLPSLAPTTIATFVMTVRMDPLAAGTVTNTATVTTTTPDTPGDNVAVATMFPLASADLAVTKTGPTTGAAGTTLTYSISLTNNGPSGAPLVNLQDVSSALTTFVSWTQTSGPAFTCTTPITGSSGGVDCNAPLLPPGATSTFTYVVRIRQDVSPGLSVSNVAQAASGAADPVFANSSAIVNTTVSRSADLQISKSGPLTGAAGLPIVYDINIRNNGPSGTDFTMLDVTPTGTTFESVQTDDIFPCFTPAVGGTGTIQCGGAAIIYPPGTSVNIRLTLRVNPDVAQGSTIANTTTTQGFGLGFSDPNATNNSATTTATIFAIADAGVSKFVDSATVAPGGNSSYTINVTNNGPADAQNITLSDVIPTGTTFVSFTETFGPGFSCSTPAAGATGTVTCTRATLARGATTSFRLTVRSNTSVSAGSTISNTATASTSTNDPTSGNNNSTATVTVLAPDLVLAKTDSPDPVSAGANITYALTVTNQGSSGANSVTLMDNTPANTTFVSVSQPSGPSFACSAPLVGDIGTVTCTHAFFAVGGTAVIRIVVRVNPGTPNGTTITNTASISTTDSEPNTTNNSSTTTTLVAVAADIAVAKSGPASVSSTGDLTYFLSITNNGPADAQNVALSDPVPPSTTFRSMTQTGGPAFTCVSPAVGGTGTVSCTAAVLAPGATSTFTLVVRASAPAGSTITNTATGTTTTTDANAANNSASTNTAVAAPDLAVTKTDAPDPVQPGNNITYNLTLANNGSAAANNVVLSDAVPTNTTFVSLAQSSGPAFTCSTPPAGSGGPVSCTTPALNAAASATFTLVVRTNAGVSSGTTISNTASASSSDPDANPGNNSATATTTVSAIADAGVTKSGPATLTPGSPATYSITVTNNGPGDAQSVTLSDTLPPGTTFASMAQTSGPSFACTTPSAGAAGTVNCTIGTLATGATAAFSLIVNVSGSAAAGSTITNSATVMTTSTDPNLADNTASSSGTVASTPDLVVTKSDSPDPVNAGGDITYTIGVANSGNAAAATVSLTDTIPANTTFVSFVAPTGWTTTTPAAGSGGTVTASTANLAAGTAASLTLVVRVTAGTAAGTMITNTATAATTSTEPVTTNNSATVTTTVAAPTQADLAITKTGPATAGSLTSVTYAILVANNGPASALSVVVTDTVPAGTTFVSADGGASSCLTPAVGGTGTISCTLAGMVPRTSTTINVTFRASAGTTTITNTATGAAATSDPNNANNTSTASTTVTSGPPAPTADLAIAKSASTPSAAVGVPFTYTITATNLGPNTATNVMVVDSLPADLTLLSASATQGTCSGTTLVTCNLGTLAGGAASATVTLTVRANRETSIVNIASVASDVVDPFAGNNSAATTTAVVVAAIPLFGPFWLIALAFTLAVAGFAARKG